MSFIRCILFMVVLTSLGGCGTSFKVVPEVSDLEESEFTLAGKVEYDGNPLYLPRTVKQSSDSLGPLVIKYTYDVGYGKDSVPELIPLFNPLTLVGFPVGSDSIVVAGVLEVISDGETVKEYCATCVIDKNRSIFYEGDTFSELRKKGLLLVRDNIEMQMVSDREFLSNM